MSTHTPYAFNSIFPTQIMSLSNVDNFITENDRKEIWRMLEMEKLRIGGSNQVNTDILRLRRELAIVEQKLKKEKQTKIETEIDTNKTTGS